MEGERDVYERDVHASHARSDHGDVSKHAGRWQLERLVLRRGARTGVHEHHELGSSRADGAAHAATGEVPIAERHRGEADRTLLESGDRIPCSAPPFGELVAVDVNRAAVRWRVPLGVFDDLKARGFDKTGTPNIGGTIATAAGLVFIGGTIDGRFRAFDADTGALLWETTLDASAHATPMTFMGRNGRQYVVIAAGGDGLLVSPLGSNIVAFALAHPEP